MEWLLDVVYPITSVYGIFTYIYHKNHLNEGKYNIPNIRRPPRKGGARLEVWTFWEFGHGVWVFLHLQCLHGVCIGWACALWLQRLCSVAVLDCSKGDVKEFFGLRGGRFSARVEMMFGSFCICSVYMVFAQAGHVLCGSEDCAPWLF